MGCEVGVWGGSVGWECGVGMAWGCGGIDNLIRQNQHGSGHLQKIQYQYQRQCYIHVVKVKML